MVVVAQLHPAVGMHGTPEAETVLAFVLRLDVGGGVGTKRLANTGFTVAFAGRVKLRTKQALLASSR